MKNLTVRCIYTKFVSSGSVFAILFFLLLLSIANPIRGEYLTPAEAGFRNCALIYFNKNYDAERIKPLLVKYVEGKPTAQPGYDAVLFLLYSINGKTTLDEQTYMPDWQKHIEIYFNQGINVPALDRAAKDLRKGGFLKEKIKVIFSIPWPHPKVHNFGDVDGDGRSEDLNTPEGLDKVLSWYIDLVSAEMKKYPELDFWGFYMMNEGINPKSQELARRFCSAIHKKGRRAFWIPYYKAPGADIAYELGFDASIMQSNWTFNTRPDGSRARRNQLVNTANWAQHNRHGIELEINPPEDLCWQNIFAQSLETGTKTGFQKAASATYFGSDFYWPFSERQETRALYSLWMDYLAGKPINLPKNGKWTEKTNSNGDSEILYQFDRPTDVRIVDLFYRNIPDDFFAALLTVEGRENQEAPWKPLGWKYNRITKNDFQILYNMTIAFMPATVKDLRIVVQPAPGGRPGKLVSAEPDPCPEFIKMTKCFLMPYTTNKKKDIPTYPDETGRQLLDGVIGGSWKNFVGWDMRQSANMALDFNDSIDFDEIRLHLLDQPSAAIWMPDSIEVIASMQSGKQTVCGFGPVPKGVHFLYDFKCDAKSGLAKLKLTKPIKTRAMTLRFNQRGWLFLSEIEFFRNGKKIDPTKFSYTLSLLERKSDEDTYKYCDDGIMLTDGLVYNGFDRGNVGMSGGKPLIVTVDLKNSTPINSVTCWLLDGHLGGVQMPRKGTVRLSNDGQKWSDPIPFLMPESKKRAANIAIPVTVAVKESARFVKVEFSSGAWTFLSEIYVE